MEEEIRKHLKEIYKDATKPGHRFVDKLRDILLEIFIIVFAVSLSIWLHNWSEHRHEKKVAKEFLRGLRSDLNEDITQIEGNRTAAANLLGMYDTLFHLSPAPYYNDHIDTLHYNFIVNLITTRPNLGRYEGFKSSGKLETIGDDSLKQKILAYFQQQVPDLSITENFINSMQLKLLDQQLDQLPSRQLVTSQKGKTIESMVIQNLQLMIRSYDETLAKIKEIIERIDRNTH